MCQIEQGERKPRFIEKPHKQGHKYLRGRFHTKIWLLNFNEIHQNAQRFKRGKGDFTQLQEGFISDGVHFQCTSATHIIDKEWHNHPLGRMGQRSDELEEPLNNF
jgi:hypothetical protein